VFASNKKNIVLLLVSIGLGALGALLAMLYLNAKEAALLERLKPKSPPISVVVASRDLVKGDVLSTSTLSIREIPSEFVSNQTVLPEQFEQIDGLVLQHNLASGKALLHSFIDQEFPVDFSDTIQEKRRGMTIQVDENNTFTGLLRPGNRIDLLVNKSAAGTGGKHVVPVLENVEVLTTGSESAKDYEEKVRILRGGAIVNPDTSFTTITVNVTPKEGAILNLAMNQGELLALLRNRKDTAGTGIVAVDDQSIEEHVQELRRQEQIRRASEALTSNIVRGKDGILRTKDGKPLANQNLVIGEDGKIRTASGIDLSGRGLTLNEKGELIDKDGNVVDPDTLKIGADGSLMTADGRVLDGAKVQTLAGAKALKDGVQLADGRVIAGATLDENGNLVLADGTVVNPDEVTINEAGEIVRADGTVIAGAKAGRTLGNIQVAEDGSLILEDGTRLNGATLTADGKIRLQDGTIVDPDDVLIQADGTVVTKDGQQLAGVTAGRTVGKIQVAQDGTLVLEDGTTLKGATLTADGKIRLADGTVVDPDNVLIRADGTVVTKDGQVLAGVSAQFNETNQVAGTLQTVDYIVGGVSKDSVATVNKVKVEQ